MSAARLPGVALALVLLPSPMSAHDGPPFPILSSHAAGPYVISIWTDPDTTDDGSAGGQFWVTLRAASGALPPETRATVVITPKDRPGLERRAEAAPVEGDVSRQFAALVMDHEGRFAVRVAIDGPLGAGRAEAEVDATYDLRPPPSMIVLYLVPFVLIGLLWGRLLIRRYRSTRADAGARTRRRD